MTDTDAKKLDDMLNQLHKLAVEFASLSTVMAEHISQQKASSRTHEIELDQHGDRLSELEKFKAVLEITLPAIKADIDRQRAEIKAESHSREAQIKAESVSREAQHAEFSRLLTAIDIKLAKWGGIVIGVSAVMSHAEGIVSFIRQSLGGH